MATVKQSYPKGKKDKEKEVDSRWNFQSNERVIVDKAKKYTEIENLQNPSKKHAKKKKV